MDEVDPYRAPTANIAPPLDALADLASRGARLGAVAIDLLCALATWIPSLLLEIASRLISPGLEDSPAWSIGGVLVSAAASLVLLGVQAFQLHRHEATLGKRALGLRIVRLDRTPATFTRLVWLRLLTPGLFFACPGSSLCCGMIWCVTVPLFAVDALMIFGSAQRCGHDYIADTVVVRKVRDPKS